MYLEILFNIIQICYFCSFLTLFYFLSRPVNWVRKTDIGKLSAHTLPIIVLFYPVLKELEETMRTTLIGVSKQQYPINRYIVVGIPNSNDTESIASLQKLQKEFPFLEVLVVPPTSDPSWNKIWHEWGKNPHAYWWHKGKNKDARDLPPKKTRQLIYAFYYYVAHLGTDWILNYIDADSIPPADHFLMGAAGMQKYDVLQSTNIAGNLMQTMAASFHAMDHLNWDFFIYPHMSANGNHPFWVLGKGLFYKAKDLYDFGSFNPWLTIEDPEVGMRLWTNGKKLGIIEDPLIEEVPITFKRGIIQRNRWVCGFFQSVSQPLLDMKMPFYSRLLARLNVSLVISLLMNTIGLPVGIIVLFRLYTGHAITSLPFAILAAVNVSLYFLNMIVAYINAWKHIKYVLKSPLSRFKFLLRVNPINMWLYWLLWTIPIINGFFMFVFDRGKVWERTQKMDANHHYRSILSENS